MRFKLLKVLGLVALAYATASNAQVPSMIGYQGRVSVSGTNFTGTGLFKFALVNGGTPTAGVQATATATVVNGFLVSVTVVNGGSGYTAVPTVTITDPTGSGAVATATVSGGVVTSVKVQDTGDGYSASPTVTITAPSTSVSFATFWSNDGSSSGGDEPSTSVSLPVSEGLFSMFLGDTGLANMLPVPATVFTNGDVRLRIWFNDGVNGFSQLSPDQRIASVGYAQMAANVPDGSINSAKLGTGAVTATNLAPNAVQSGVVATGAIGTAQIADGAVTAAKIASGAVGSTQLAASAITGSTIAPNTIDITKLNFTPLTAEVDPKVAVTTSNAVPRWNGTVLTNGSVFDNGNVGIGTGNPAAKLDVTGAVAINGMTVINTLGQWVGNPTGLVGPQGPVGATGLPGPAGTNGNTVWNGSGAPSSALGTNGDFYIDTSGKAIYGPKSGSSWGTGISLVGPQGVAGATGAQGVAGVAGPVGATGLPGPAGTNGNTVWNGSGAPSSALGTNGDFYIDTDAKAIFGPKTGGSWGSGVALVGPQGPQGLQGATGAQGVAGVAGPAGAQGPKGLNWLGTWNSGGSYTTNDAVEYDGSAWVALQPNTNVAPTAGANWALLASKGDTGSQGSQGLVGPIGPKGDKGDTGAQGVAGPAGATGATGPQGPEGPAGPAVHTSATCMWGNQNCDTVCGGSAHVVVRAGSSNGCAVTSDTGPCNYAGAYATCCVCKP